MEVVMKFFNIVLVVMIGLAVGTTHTGEIAKINENLAILAGLFSTDQEAEYNRLIDDLGKLHKRMPDSVESMTRQQLGMGYQELLKRHLVDFLRQQADIQGKVLRGPLCAPLLDSIKVWIPDYPGVKDRKDMLKEIFLTLQAMPLCTEHVALSIARYAPGLIQGPTRGNYNPKILANYARRLQGAKKAIPGKWADVIARLARPELLAEMQDILDRGNELFDAVINKNLAKVQELIAQGASVNVNAEKPWLAARGHLSLLECLVEIANGSVVGTHFLQSMLQVLVDAGTNPNMYNNRVLKDLVTAGGLEDEEKNAAIPLLVNAQTNLSDNPDGGFILGMAIRYTLNEAYFSNSHNLEAITQLLAHGANPNASFQGERTFSIFQGVMMEIEQHERSPDARVLAQVPFINDVLALLRRYGGHA